MSMRIAFRVDANAQIGTGHFMRCLTLAEALHDRGAQIRFVCRGLPPHLCEMLTIKGIAVAQLLDGVSTGSLDELAHAAWLPVGQRQDAKDTMQVLAGEYWDWLVIDHYALDARWETAMRACTSRILVIDDLADRSHDCDVLLDQNHDGDMQAGYVDKVPAACQLLLGPRYALLRDAFRHLREQACQHAGEVKRILVFFGGVDAGNCTGIAIRALSRVVSQRLAVDVVIGAQHPHRSEIERACIEAGYGLHVQTQRMAELMASADLAVGAGGSAVWERCCLGLPSLTICTADNQRQQVKGAAQAGWLYAPTIEGDLVELIERHVRCLLDNPSLLHHMADAAMQAVDGLGTIRVAGLLACGAVDIRPADEGDAQDLFEWRNRSSVRAVSRHMEPIEWETHRTWLTSVLIDPNRALLIGAIGGVSVGVVRFDMEGDSAEVSIYLVPQVGRSGLGRHLLRGAEQWLAVHRSDIKKVRAEVLVDNVVSQRLFLDSEYVVDQIHYLKALKAAT